jgi:hypothetical protein
LRAGSPEADQSAGIFQAFATLHTRKFSCTV